MEPTSSANLINVRRNLAKWTWRADNSPLPEKSVLYSAVHESTMRRENLFHSIIRKQNRQKECQQLTGTWFGFSKVGEKRRRERMLTLTQPSLPTLEAVTAVDDPHYKHAHKLRYRALLLRSNRIFLRWLIIGRVGRFLLYLCRGICLHHLPCRWAANYT